MEIHGYTLPYRKLVHANPKTRGRSASSSTYAAAGSQTDALGPGRTTTRWKVRPRTRSPIRSNLVTGEDLYLIAQQIDANGTVFFKAEVLPLVNLIWLAGSSLSAEH